MGARTASFVCAARHVIRGTVGALALQNGSVRVDGDRDAPNECQRRRPAAHRIRSSSIRSSDAAGGRVLARGGLGIKKLQRAVVRPASGGRKRARARQRSRVGARGRWRLGARVRSIGPYVSGRIGVRNGVIAIPPSEHKEVISARDPALVSARGHVGASTKQTTGSRAQSPLMANLRMDVTVDVDRDTWVRTNEANVEIYTPPDREPDDSHGPTASGDRARRRGRRRTAASTSS